MKKILFGALSALLTVGLSVSAAGCDKKDNENATLIDNRIVLLTSYETQVEAGKTVKLGARLSLGKGVFSWASSDENVATVNEYGEVTGVAAGEATITATCGNKSESCRVTVVLPDGYPVFTKGDERIEVLTGETFAIDNAVSFNGKNVEAKCSYENKDDDVASVADGVISAKKEGATEISVIADYCGLITTKTITVIVRGRMIVESEADSAALQLIADTDLGYTVEGSLAFRAIYDLADVTASIDGISWRSDNEEIVSVRAAEDKDGAKRAEIGAVSAGRTKVYCAFTYGGEEYSYSFDVTAEKSFFIAAGAVVEDSMADGEKTADITAEMPSQCTISHALKASLGGEELAVKSTGDVIVTARPEKVGKGETDIRFEDEKWICSFEDGVYCTAVLTNASHEVLLDGGTIFAGEYYVLGEDIEIGWSGESMDPVKVLGALDGRGYTLKGITVDKPSSGWKKDPGDSSQTCASYISVNEGTIKNLCIEYSVSSACDNGALTFTSLIQQNLGEINNVLVFADIRGCAWFGSAFTAKNYGVIENCVNVIPDYASNQGLRDRMSAYVAFSYGGTVRNCYTLGEKWEGLTDADAAGAGKCYSEAYTGGAIVENWRGLADMGEIADSEKFSSVDGWRGYWQWDSDGVTFSGREISLIPTTYIHTEYAEEKDGNIIISVPEELTLDNATVTFGDTAVTPVSLANGVLSIAKGNFSYGEYSLKIAYPDKVYKAKNISFVTKAIRNADAADFASIFEANPNGYFVLAEDIDFGGGSLAGNISFKGTFDGKGHSLKNFTIDWAKGADGNGWNAYVFKENKGTIRNLSLEFSLKDSPNDVIAFVSENKGLIENVYAKCTIIETIKEDYQKAAALVQKNDGGKIRNCVAVMTLASGVEIGKDSAGGEYSAVAAISWYNVNGGEIDKCYVVVGENEIPVIAVQWATAGDVAAYVSIEDLTAALKFDTADGWSKYWKTENGDIVFGE